MKSPPNSVGTLLHLTNAVTAALMTPLLVIAQGTKRQAALTMAKRTWPLQCSRGSAEPSLGGTHNTPMLMAIAMPIFSLRRMERVMIVGQGINARTRSITPLYAIGKSVSSLTALSR